MGQSYKLRIAAKTLRSIDHIGGLDAYLMKAKDDNLSDRVLKIKRALKKKTAAA